MRARPTRTTPRSQRRVSARSQRCTPPRSQQRLPPHLWQRISTRYRQRRSSRSKHSHLRVHVVHVSATKDYFKSDSNFATVETVARGALGTLLTWEPRKQRTTWQSLDVGGAQKNGTRNMPHGGRQQTPHVTLTSHRQRRKFTLDNGTTLPLNNGVHNTRQWPTLPLATPHTPPDNSAHSP